jgi:hypothetical protein
MCEMYLALAVVKYVQATSNVTEHMHTGRTIGMLTRLQCISVLDLMLRLSEVCCLTLLLRLHGDVCSVLKHSVYLCHDKCHLS